MKPYLLTVLTYIFSFCDYGSWNEWVSLPLRFADISRTAILNFTIFDCAGGREQATVVGSTAISFFSSNGLFRQVCISVWFNHTSAYWGFRGCKGLYDLKVWPQMKSTGPRSSSIPSHSLTSGVSQMQRLSRLAKEHRNGEMNKVSYCRT